MKTCKFCPTPVQDDICESCRASLGLVAGGGVRPQLPCQRCNHPELVRALAREFTTSPGEYGVRESRPMAVTAEPVPEHTFFAGRPKGVHVEVDQYRGILEMYICRKCGFTEWYCRDPRSIPIGAEYGTEKLGGDPTGPYR
jgi:hypothetical protein